MPERRSAAGVLPGGGWAAGGERPPGMGTARPPAHCPHPRRHERLRCPCSFFSSSSPSSTHCTAQTAAVRTEREVGAGAKPSSDWVRILAAGGGGGREGREETVEVGMLLWAGDITAQRPVPAASSLRGRGGTATFCTSRRPSGRY